MKKIRIVHILNTLSIGGKESSVIELCNNLNCEKYEVSILVLSNNFLNLQNNISKNISINILPVKHQSVSFWDTFYLLLNINKITKFLKKYNPNIIHTHSFQYNIIPILIAIRIAAKKSEHFHTIHTSGIHYENKTFKHKIKLLIERSWYIKCKTTIICVSKIAEKQIKNSYLDKRVIVTTIFNGVDNKKFDSALYFPNKHNDYIRLVYTARLDYGKSHDILLRAFTLLLKSNKNIELVLIGDGVLRKIIELQIKELQIENNVKLLGNCFNVPEILAYCDIGVFPSEFEGFSIALIEMMSMGLPIVCTDIPNFRAIFYENEVCFFQIRDYISLYNQIEKLIIDKELRYEYSQKSLRTSQKYSIKNMVLSYEKIYNDIYMKNSLKCN